MPTDYTRSFKFERLSDVKAANAEIGNHWFSPGTLQFFNSRLETDLIDGKYFITSERFEISREYPKRFTIRIANANATISDLGKFQEHKTLAAALKALDRFRTTAQITGYAPTEQPTWEALINEARRLSPAELARHAAVSYDNKHSCTACFCCACCAVLQTNPPATTEDKD